MITLERAKTLQYRETIIDQFGKRWRVNGEVKTWKRDPNRVRIPVKHGLYSYDYITESDLDTVTLEFPDQENQS